MLLDAPRWCETVATGERARLLEALLQRTDRVRAQLSGLAALRAASPDDAPARLRWLVIEQLAAELRLQPDQIVGTKPFRALGLDSLMGLELRNRLERSLELKLSASVIWNYPTVDRLCEYLAERLGIAPNVSEPDDIDLDAELAEAEALLISL
jgi:acyl carrier protein